MTDSPLSGRILACPSCGKATAFTASNKWRPFCSERCKLIDLGDWASERFRVPVEEEKKEPGEDTQGPG